MLFCLLGQRLSSVELCYAKMWLRYGYFLLKITLTHPSGETKIKRWTSTEQRGEKREASWWCSEAMVVTARSVTRAAARSDTTARPLCSVRLPLTRPSPSPSARAPLPQRPAPAVPGRRRGPQPAWQRARRYGGAGVREAAAGVRLGGSRQSAGGSGGGAAGLGSPRDRPPAPPLAPAGEGGRGRDGTERAV